KVARGPGYPYEPTGNPMLAGVGPGSWAERKDIPDLTAHGDARIVPMRTDEGFSIAAGETDPMGMTVIGCDGQPAGTVKDVWVDRSEHLIRYYEIELEGGATVLLPNNFVVIKEGRARKLHLYVHAITSEQFADVPKLAKPELVTRLEEDKITAYYGSGHLYAVRGREEPWL
ncbi:MAG: photosynthetic reaction center subunit H, partial [Pseudomonadota bacterium]